AVSTFPPSSLRQKLIPTNSSFITSCILRHANKGLLSMIVSHSILKPTLLAGSPDLERVICDYCGQDQTIRLATLPAVSDLLFPLHRVGGSVLNIGQDRINFCKCQVCGLVYMNPRLIEQAITRFYDSVYSTPLTRIGDGADPSGRGAYLL